MIRKTLAVFALLLCALVALVIWSYSDAVSTVPEAGKVVVLTYDDGPNPPHTRATLDMLERHGVRATFFLKGANVEAFPEEAAAVAAAGHEIGNHSWSHPVMISFSRDAMLDEIVRTDAVIEAATGIRPELFRPPYGAQGLGLKRALELRGLPSILMSAHGADWEVFDAVAIADRVLRDTGPGGIILLHDGHGDVDDPRAQDSRAGTVEATGLIIEALRAEGYRFVTVGELLQMAAP